MTRRRFGQGLVAALICTLPSTAAGAQNPVRVEGKVAWISANRMVVAPRSGQPVPVDLSEVDLEQYRALLTGDRVVVTGRLSPEGDRIVATSIQRLQS